MRMRFLWVLPLAPLLLAGCTDKPAPSEAAVEPDVTTPLRPFRSGSFAQVELH